MDLSGLLVLCFLFQLSDCAWKIQLNEEFNGLDRNELKDLLVEPDTKFRPKYIDKLNLDFLKDYPNLDKFEIHGFDFGSAERVRFGKQLKILWLWGLQMRTVQEDLLFDLENVEDVSLGANYIEVIPDNLLKNNRKLKNFWFYSNKIKVIPPNLFSGLTDLEFVHFGENQLEFLQGHLFKDNRKMKKVHFNDNKIQKISPGLLDGLALEYKLFRNNPCVVGEDDLTKCFVQQTKIDEIDNEVCGKSLQIQPLVFGGSQSLRGKYPWIAAFYYHNNFQCGSSLISRKHIMLAAHCIHDRGTSSKEPENSKFKLGRYSLSADEPGSLDAEVSKFILHPDWISKDFEYRGDIALAVLKSKVEYSQYIRPICLNTEKFFNFYGKTGTVVGWGTGTGENSRKASDVALEINIKIFETRDCLALDRELTYFITQTSFCAGNRNGTGSCKGDSGGSLFVKDGDRFKSIGIVSASIKSDEHECNTFKNQIYTEVAPYHDWIMEHVGST